MSHTTSQPPVGTTYLTSDGYLLRIARYEHDINDLMALDDDQDAADLPKKPIYDLWTPHGGASKGEHVLPQDAVRVVLPEPERPAVGSAWLVEATGDVYRLTDYRTNWNSETLEKTVPSYTVSLAEGGSTNRDRLPEGARLIWTP